MSTNKSLAKVYQFDSYGKRQEKYDRLNNSSFLNIDWKELELKEPYYFFVPKDFAAEEKYMQGFSVSEIFKEFNSGIQTKNDSLSVHYQKQDLETVVFDFQVLEEEILKHKYNLKDTSGWNVKTAKFDICENQGDVTKILYKPFDARFTYYTGKSSGFLGRPRDKQSKYMLRNNLCIFTTRTFPPSEEFNRIFIGNSISDIHIISDQTYFFPLYLYHTKTETLLDEDFVEKTPNFDIEVIAKIEKKLDMKLNEDFSPEDLLDYIYAVLHSKSYRETYKEFLKIDFPRVPFDVSREIFFQMVRLGRELRVWHLLEHNDLVPQNFITIYPENGDNRVDKVSYKNPYCQESGLGDVFINDTQYFQGVPQDVWEFYIGGYQPAQKWLKDRKGRSLNYEDIVHYGKIILTLSKTIGIMEEIELVYKNAFLK